MALARHLEPGLTPPRGVERIGDVRAALEPRLLAAFEGRVAQQAFAEDTEREERMRSVQDRVGTCSTRGGGSSTTITGRGSSCSTSATS